MSLHFYNYNISNKQNLMTDDNIWIPDIQIINYCAKKNLHMSMHTVQNFRATFTEVENFMYIKLLNNEDNDLTLRDFLPSHLIDHIYASCTIEVKNIINDLFIYLKTINQQKEYDVLIFKNMKNSDNFLCTVKNDSSRIPLFEIKLGLIRYCNHYIGLYKLDFEYKKDNTLLYSLKNPSERFLKKISKHLLYLSLFRINLDDQETDELITNRTNVTVLASPTRRDGLLENSRSPR